MKKNIRDYKVKGQQFSYLLDLITSEDQILITDKDKVIYLFKTFRDEFNFRINQIGLRDALAEWLQGMPSAIELDYWDDDIVKIGKSWGYCKTPYKERIFIANWYIQAANNLIKIKEYFNI